METQFYTITIEDNCYDLPKNMPVPQKGSLVFIEGKTCRVESINYHISRGKLHTVSVFAERLT